MRYCLDIGCGTSLQADTKDESWLGIDQAKSPDPRIWVGDIRDILEPESFQYFCDDGSGKTAFDGLSENYGVRTLFKMVSHNFFEDSIIHDVMLQK